VQKSRVRTILVLGYWVLGDIRRYWVVLLLGGISVYDTQYDTDQTAVSTVRVIIILTSVMRPLSADDGREGKDRVQAIHRHHHTVFEILCGIVLNIHFRSIRCYATQEYQHLYRVFVSLEANIIGYWILGGFRSNPTEVSCIVFHAENL